MIADDTSKKPWEGEGFDRLWPWCERIDLGPGTSVDVDRLYQSFKERLLFELKMEQGK